MAIVDNINSPDNAPSFESIDKKPRVYQTDAMLYRLTRRDATRIYQDNPPFSKAEQMNIQVALKKFINERKRTIHTTCELFDYLGKMIETDKKNNPNNRKFNYTKDDFHDIVCSTLFSYFYNAKYSSIADIKAFNVNGEDPNLYNFLSFEELRYVNIMKDELMKHHNQNPNESFKDFISFAENLAMTGRKVFIKTFKVDPILLQISNYSCSEVTKVSDYLDKKMAHQKKMEAMQKSAVQQ